MIQEKFHYPVLERDTKPNGVRHYICPQTGNALPSVTTILDYTADKEFLVEWRKRVGAKRAEEESTFGKNLGALVHEDIERHLEGRERLRGNAPLRRMARGMAQQVIISCLPRVNEVWGIEKALYVPALYAGTADLLGVHDGYETIMDHKNAKKMREKEQIDDYRDQLAAYAIAHNEVYGTRINRGAVFMVSRDLVARTYVWEGLEFQKGIDSFLRRTDIYLRNHS